MHRALNQPVAHIYALAMNMVSKSIVIARWTPSWSPYLEISHPYLDGGVCVDRTFTYPTRLLIEKA